MWGSSSAHLTNEIKGMNNAQHQGGSRHSCFGIIEMKTFWRGTQMSGDVAACGRSTKSVIQGSPRGMPPIPTEPFQTPQTTEVGDDGHAVMRFDSAVVFGQCGRALVAWVNLSPTPCLCNTRCRAWCIECHPSAETLICIPRTTPGLGLLLLKTWK